MATKEKKATITKDFRKSNFSCNLENELPEKEAFFKVQKGVYSGDLPSLYNDMKKAKNAFDKETNKEDSKKETDEKKGK